MKYMTVEQVANELQLSTMTVYRLVKSGDLSSVRVSEKCIRIKAEDFQLFLDERST